MYRVHDAPDPTRIEALRQFLEGLDLKLARGQVIRPKHFTRLLELAKTTPYAATIHALVLRSQSQAVYAPVNLGHFGLALTRYAHFTSPIRRYSDLLVHRALISGYGFGEDGLAPETTANFETIGQHISATERRAAAAERDAVDRYVAHFMAERVGEIFPGRISGVAKFGLFVALHETGADGLLPISLLPNDFYDHDDRRHALVGRRWGRSFELGAPIVVKLLTAQPLTGGLTFEFVEGGMTGEADRPARPRAGAAGKPSPHRGRTSGKGAKRLKIKNKDGKKPTRR
jgi:ribonuclease R